MTALGKIFIKHCCETILLVCLIAFFCTKHTYEEDDRVIVGDGKGYYAYLPAVFIYGDLEYQFVDSMEQQYYPADGSTYKNFKYEYKGESVNKTFSGISLLWLPFFLLAHFLSFLLGYPTDGYSLLYQYAIGVAAIFYLWWGCRLLRQLLLKFKASDALAAWVLYALVFGTNLLFYTLWDPSLTHVYNFFLIAAFLFLAHRVFERYRRKNAVLASFVLGAIVATRPQDGLIVFALPFIAGSFSKLIGGFTQWLKDWRGVLMSLVAGGAVLMIPVLFWYAQTGYLVVYSYGEEGFNFSDPHWIDVLFSYRKGWFVYTPLAFFAMLGFVTLLLQNRFRFFSLGLFFFLVLFVLSSWWCWWYGACFGQRAFIDFYALIAILLVLAYRLLQKVRLLQYLFTLLLLLCIGLNVVQSYQHRAWILPSDQVNKEAYWGTFLVLERKSRIWIHEADVLQRVTFFNDLEKYVNDAPPDTVHWININHWSTDIAFSGQLSSKINEDTAYSIGMKEPIAPYLHSDSAVVKVSAMVWQSSDTTDTRLVIEFWPEDAPGVQSYQYEPHHIREFYKKEEWVRLEYVARVPQLQSEQDVLGVYFWNPDHKDSVYVDDLKVEVISYK